MEVDGKKLKGRTPAQTAKIIERGTKVFELRKRGASLRAIAATLKKQDIEAGGNGRGFSHEQVRKDYLGIINVKLDEQQDMASEARALTAERLDDLMIRISPLLDSSKPKTKIAAANVLIRANKEYAELHGAKRPQRVEVTGQDGVPLIPRDISINISKIYGSDTGNENDTDDENGSGGEGGGDAAGPA